MTKTPVWQYLLAHALETLDHAIAAGMPADDWSFGGGTVLMLRYRHRASKDIDIFIPEPQHLAFLTPRLNSGAEIDMVDYVEQFGSIKIYYPEGEVDFVAATTLTPTPFVTEELLGRAIKMETSTEIVAKKIAYRSADFKARDLFDLAMVLSHDATSRTLLGDHLNANAETLMRRLTNLDHPLREDFQQIDTLEFHPSYDDCLEIILPYLRQN